MQTVVLQIAKSSTQYICRVFLLTTVCDNGISWKKFIV